jgi:CBS domain-containing protein
MLGRDAPRRPRNEQAQSEYEEVEMQVKDAMTKDPLAIRIDATIQEAAAGMRQADVGALPVVSDENTLVGIVTDRDLAIRALAEGLSPGTP